jgi:outer membrane protein TolC
MNVKTRVLWTLVAAIALAMGALGFAPVSAQSTPRAALPTPVPSPLLPLTPTVAPGYQAPEVAPTSANIVGVTEQPFVGIALQDAIGMALLKNPNLAVSASNARIAGYQVVEAKGAFDISLRVNPSSVMSVQPATNLFFAGPNGGNIIQHQSSLQYGLGGQTENGTQFTAGIQHTRTYNNVTLNTFEPYYLASLNVSVTQPLLKNLGMNLSKRQLKLAFVNADNDTAQSLVDTSNTVLQVEDAYWNLVSAWRNVAIQESALKDAIAQQHSNVRLARRGAAAPIDAIESSTVVSNLQDSVFSALQNVAQLQNQLKVLIVADPGDPIWRANLVPTSSVQQLPTVPDLNGVIAIALKNRPEVRQARDKHAQADIDLAFAKNQALPQADLQVNYQSNGFAGLPTPVTAFELNSCLAQGLPACPTPPPYSQGTMPEAYHNLWTFKYPTFNIGVVVSQPLGSHVAKGMKGIANEEQRQAELLTQGVTARIGFEARNALQIYQSALSRLYAARSARAASEQVLASEQRKFKNGASTTFLVLQRQVELNQNRGRELLAQTDLNKAVVELQRVEGTILTDNGVDAKTLGSQALPASAAPLPASRPSASPATSPAPQ